MTYRPLDGLRVVDFSRLVPGGLTTLRLAQLGADVVKVEDARRGDYLRTIPPIVKGVGLLHSVLNRGKRSVAVDFTTPSGSRLARSLLEVADVVVESSRPGGLGELGVDLAVLREERPEVVVCSVTGFGQTGPYAGIPSHGLNMDALAGHLRVSRLTGVPHLAHGQHGMAAELGAVNAALAVVAAVLAARATGRGVWLDASCWDAGVEAHRLALSYQSETGEPLFDAADLGPLYDLYESADSRVFLFAPIEAKFWRSFCEGVGRPDLTDRWSGHDVFFGEGDTAIGDELRAIFRTRTASEWIRFFEERDLPGTEVISRESLLSNPHLVHRSIVEPSMSAADIPHSVSPIRSFEFGRAGEELRLAPALGEHTEEVADDWLQSSAPSEFASPPTGSRR